MTEGTEYVKDIVTEEHKTEWTEEWGGLSSKKLNIKSPLKF